MDPYCPGWLTEFVMGGCVAVAVGIRAMVTGHRRRCVQEHDPALHCHDEHADPPYRIDSGTTGGGDPQDQRLVRVGD
jgi:hypothetical protein